MKKQTVTNEEQIEPTLVDTTEPQVAKLAESDDPNYDIVANSDEFTQEVFFKNIQQVINSIHQSGDAIIEIRVRPGIVETFMEQWVEMKLHESPEADMQIRQQIRITPDEKCPNIQFVRRSEMEYQFLVNHFQNNGLFKYIEAMHAPLILTPDVLKNAFIMEALMDVKEMGRSKILTPGSGPFLPPGIKVK